jgi:hypothetical protein
MDTFQFKPAVRTQRLLRLALMGPTGSGKSYTALQLAKGIAGPLGRIALVDTENHSASLYADDVAFDTLALTTFSPDRYIEAIHAAEDAGYGVLVIDSLSHAWAGKEGALEQVDKKAGTGNSFAAWRTVTPLHNSMVDALVHCKLHLIVTMRVKTEYALEKDDRGKMVPRKIGMQPVQRDGLEYEFDVVADMHEATLTIGKTRFSEYHGKQFTRPGERVGADLVKWLNHGTPRTEAQVRPPITAPDETTPPPPAPVKLALRPVTAAGKGTVGIHEVADVPAGGWVVTIRRGDALARLSTGSEKIADTCKLAQLHSKEVEVEWVVTEGVATIRWVDAPWARPMTSTPPEPEPTPERVIEPDPAPEPEPARTPAKRRSKSIAEIVGPKA